MKKQLPVLPILITAIDLCCSHLSYALKIITPWFLVLFLGPSILVSLNGKEALEAVDGATFWETVFFILEITAWGSIAVLWHWRILRDDSLSGHAMIFDKRVWLYILKFILISIVMAGSGFLLIMSISYPPASFIASILGGTGFFIMFVGAILSAILIGARLSIALPAVALNIPDFGFRDAWKATDGHGVRLFIVTFLPFLPVSLLFMQFTVNGSPVFDAPLSWAPFALKHFVFEFVEFGFGLLTLTVLSLTYAFFVESRGTRPVQQT